MYVRFPDRSIAISWRYNPSNFNSKIQDPTIFAAIAASKEIASEVTLKPNVFPGDKAHDATEAPQRIARNRNNHRKPCLITQPGIAADKRQNHC